MQATVDTRPEDLLVTPVIEGQSKLRYVASSLVTAMIRGGIAILDEGNRMSEKSWASLAPLLDNRRYVESIVAGIKIQAHPLFRMVATMNDDASTFDLPEYIHSRLQPQITIDFPERHEEYAILKENLPFGEDHILNYVTDLPAAGAFRRRTLHRSRRNQYCAVRHEIEGNRRGPCLGF
jgi:MoxR-like ATPase